MLNDYKLNEYVESIVEDILEDCDDIDSAMDQAHECADGSEYVIYYARAHELCQNCNTDMGEEFVEDIGVGDNPTYESIACLIAYGELRGRIERAIHDHFEDVEGIV